MVGTGFTGARILKRLPEDQADGINRSIPAGIDAGRITQLSLDDELPSLATAPSIVYTVAPPREGPDERLKRLFSSLAPP